jgi:hypothetical protein
VRVAGWVVLCNYVAVAAYTKRLTAKRIRSTLFETRVHIRNFNMTPDTGVGLCLAGFKLVVSVKGSVVLLYVAAETKIQPVGYTISTQQIAIGHRIRPLSPASPGDIMTTETCKLSILKGNIGRHLLRNSYTRRHIHRVGLSRGEPPIVTRLTQF